MSGAVSANVSRSGVFLADIYGDVAAQGCRVTLQHRHVVRVQRETMLNMLHASLRSGDPCDKHNAHTAYLRSNRLRSPVHTREHIWRC